MPAKSKAQFKFMQMIAHDPEIAKEHDMKPEQAKEFVSANKGNKRYSKLINNVKKGK